MLLDSLERRRTSPANGALPYAHEFEAPTCDDDCFVPTPERIAEQIEIMSQTKLSPDLAQWVEKYAAVGKRNPYLWGWVRRGVEVTTLSCVAAEWRDAVCDTKTLGVMLDVLLDDVADHQQDETFLEFLLIRLTFAGHADVTLSPEQRSYAQLTEEIWNEVQRRVRGFPHFEEFADLLRFDYWQLFNVMRFSRLLNRRPSLLNLVEHDLYSPHNMHMVISSTMDLMCSPSFDVRELGRLREAVLRGQYMGRIGNLVTTWQREIGEGDFTSGVFARAVSLGDLSIQELHPANRQPIEEAIFRGNHETYFLSRWQQYRRELLAMRFSLKTVDLAALVQGLQRLICLHLGSRGYK